MKKLDSLTNLHYSKGMSATKYTYTELIDAYFRSIGSHFSKFSANSCRLYVQQYKKKFDNEKFLKNLAERLVELDDEISDYSSGSEDEGANKKEERSNS